MNEITIIFLFTIITICVTCPPDIQRPCSSSIDCQRVETGRIGRSAKFGIESYKRRNEHRKGKRGKCGEKRRKNKPIHFDNRNNNVGVRNYGYDTFGQFTLEQQGMYDYKSMYSGESREIEENGSFEEDLTREDDSSDSSSSSSEYSDDEEDEHEDWSHQRAMNKFKSSLENGYFNVKTCAKVGVEIREFLPKCLLKELEEHYMETKCNFLSAFSSYPVDIAPFIINYAPSDLQFDVVMIGGGPGTLTALKTFVDTGKTVLLIEKGKYPPLKAISLYNRPSLLLTDYVRKVKATAPGCDFPKTVVRPHVLGGITTLNFNQWEVGSKKYYDIWKEISEKWSWEKVSPYYELIENYAEMEAAKNSRNSGTVELITETTRIESLSQNSTYHDKYLYREQSNKPDGSSHNVVMQSERKGYLSINKTVKETTVTKRVYSAFAEIGLCGGDLKITSLQEEEGFAVVPVISEGKNNILFAQKTLELVEGKENIKIAMNTEAIKIEFDDAGKAVGVIVKTDAGPVRTIRVLEELILGSSAISPVKLLTQSGVGDKDVLESLGIPLKIELPNLGKRLRISPSFFGLCVSFPQGALVDEDEEDDDSAAGLAYLYGQKKITSGALLNFYKAYMKIDSDSSNVRVNFHVFSKGSSRRLRNYVKGFFHFETEVEDFICNLCETRDLLFLVPQLRYPESDGNILVDVDSSTSESVNTVIDTGMLKEEVDMRIMLKSVERLKEIARTKTFTDLKGELIKIPLKGCPDDQDNDECYVRYFTVPGLLISGGMLMGRDVNDSVVNENLIVHGTKNVRCFSSAVLPFSLGGESAACPAMIGLYGAKMMVSE